MSTAEVLLLHQVPQALPQMLSQVFLLLTLIWLLKVLFSAAQITLMTRRNN